MWLVLLYCTLYCGWSINVVDPMDQMLKLYRIVIQLVVFYICYIHSCRLLSSYLIIL